MTHGVVTKIVRKKYWWPFGASIYILFFIKKGRKMPSLIELMDDDSMGLNSKTIHDIITMASTDIVKNNLQIVTIDPVDAIRYKGNMFGLLKNVLNIPNSALYINMVVNGYQSSLEYDGKLRLKILNADTAQYIVNLLQEYKTMEKGMGL